MMFAAFNRYLTLHLQIISWLFCFFILSAESIAQTVDTSPATKPSISTVSVEGINLKLDELELDTTIDQINRDALERLYGKTHSDL